MDVLADLIAQLEGNLLLFVMVGSLEISILSLVVVIYRSTRTLNNFLYRLGMFLRSLTDEELDEIFLLAREHLDIEMAIAPKLRELRKKRGFH